MTHIIQSSSEGGTCSPPAPPHRLQNSKWPLGGLKMADMVWKVDYSYFFGRSKQLSLDKFFDPRTPSMRKGCDGGEKKLKVFQITFCFPNTHNFSSCWNIGGTLKISTRTPQILLVLMAKIHLWHHKLWCRHLSLLYYIIDCFLGNSQPAFISDFLCPFVLPSVPVSLDIDIDPAKIPCLSNKMRATLIIF